MKSYYENLRDPRWQMKRLEIMKRDGAKCTACEDSESCLHVHHSYYKGKRMPWEYPGFSLKTVCEECHNTKHEFESELDEFERIMEWLSCGGIPDGPPLYELAVQFKEAVDDGVHAVKMMEYLIDAIHEVRHEYQKMRAKIDSEAKG